MGETIASTQLARLDGVERRYVQLSLISEGIDLTAQDLGRAVEEQWGDTDYEFGVKFATADLPKLAYALIAKHYCNDLNAVANLKELAGEAGIDANFWSYA